MSSNKKNIRPPTVWSENSQKISVSKAYFSSIEKKANDYDRMYSDNQKLENLLKKYNPTQVVLFVEWVTDIMHITRAWEVLYGKDEMMPFKIVNAYGAHGVYNLMIEKNYSRETWIALFDFDSEWLTQWKSLFDDWHRRWALPDLDKCISIWYKNKYAFLLPIPLLLEGQVISDRSYLWETTGLVGQDVIATKEFNILNACFEGHPKLVIEHLYYSTFAQLDHYYPKLSSHNWWHYFSCPENKKTDFLDKIFLEIGNNEAELKNLFWNFQPLFDKILSVIKRV